LKNRIPGRLKRAFSCFLVAWAYVGASFAYEPQISIGAGVSQLEDRWRYSGSMEFYNENLMLGGFLGMWPRLDVDTDGSRHALFANIFTVAGIVNAEYGYTHGLGHTVGLEFNSRFIPAVFIPKLSQRGERIVRDLEIFFRVHRQFENGNRFYQTGVKLVFHFPGFKVVTEESESN